MSNLFSAVLALYRRYFFHYRTYKLEYRAREWKCPFECYHDEECDFYVDVHGYCCYGSWTYTGACVACWTNQVTLYVKNGKDNLLNKHQKKYIHESSDVFYGGCPRFKKSIFISRRPHKRFLMIWYWYPLQKNILILL